MFKTGTGNPNYKAVPSYSAVHQRMRLTLGPAKLQKCLLCNRQAYAWSYMGGAPDQVLGRVQTGSLLWYSPSMEYYKPLCSKHHYRNDRLQIFRELQEYREIQFQQQETSSV